MGFLDRSPVLVSRTVTEQETSVGPWHDPYSRNDLRVIQHYADGTRLDVCYIDCALAGTALFVNGQRVHGWSPPGSVTDLEARELFADLVGCPVWIVRRARHRLDSRGWCHDPYPDWM